MIVNRRPNLTHHRRRILTHPDLYDLLPFLCSGLSVVWSVREVGVGADSAETRVVGLSVVWSVREVGVGADSAETRVVGQEVTNEVALSATISGGPIFYHICRR